MQAAPDGSACDFDGPRGRGPVGPSRRARDRRRLLAVVGQQSLTERPFIEAKDLCRTARRRRSRGSTRRDVPCADLRSCRSGPQRLSRHKQGPPLHCGDPSYSTVRCPSRCPARSRAPGGAKPLHSGRPAQLHVIGVPPCPRSPSATAAHSCPRVPLARFRSSAPTRRNSSATPTGPAARSPTAAPATGPGWSRPSARCTACLRRIP